MTVLLDGERLTVIVGAPTVSVAVAVAFETPLAAPVTVIVELPPGVVPRVVFTVSTDVVEVEVGLNDAVAPAGRPLAESDAAPENPLWPVTVTV